MREERGNAMNVVNNMVVDFARPSKTNTIIVSENDANSRKLRFTLLYDKTPFDMSDVQYAAISTNIDNDMSGDYADIIVDEDGNNTNVVEYTLPAQLTMTTGTMVATITLGSGNDESITSFEFYIKIRNALYSEDDKVNADDMAGFKRLLLQCQNSLAVLKDKLAKDRYPTEQGIRIKVDDLDIVWEGKNYEEILMGEVTYLAEELGEIEEAIDESAAKSANDSALAAAQSALEAHDYLSAIEIIKIEIDRLKTQTTQSEAQTKAYYDGINNIVPRVSLTQTTDGAELTMSSYDNPTGQTVILHHGTRGDDGRGIDRVEKTSLDGQTDIYTIYFSDNSAPFEFRVQNGSGAVSSVSSDFTLTDGQIALAQSVLNKLAKTSNLNTDGTLSSYYVTKNGKNIDDRIDASLTNDYWDYDKTYSAGDIFISNNKLYKVKDGINTVPTGVSPTNTTYFEVTSLSEINAEIQSKADMSALVNVYRADGRTTIPANTDMNNVTTPGFYLIPNSATANTITNLPYKVASMINVIGSDVGWLFQEIVGYNVSSTSEPVIYRRARSFLGSSGTSWGKWYKYTGTTV